MTGKSQSPTRRNELALRLMSAALLVPFAIYVVWAGGLVSAAGCAFVAALLAYEWVRMTNSPSMKILVSLAIIPAIVAGFWGIFYALLALLVCTIIAAITHPLADQRLRSGFGLFYTAGMPLALFALRIEPAWNGLMVALILMTVVWASDTGAFFTGRTLRGPPLSSISPSKTWSGAIGGVISSMLVGILAAKGLDGNFLAWAIAGGAISIAAQAGDLFESLIKRRLGVKDASGLLPGHGGVMDRVDGLGVAAAVGVVTLLVFPALVIALGVTP